jgi:hypothetical protein
MNEAVKHFLKFNKKHLVLHHYKVCAHLKNKNIELAIKELDSHINQIEFFRDSVTYAIDQCHYCNNVPPLPKLSQLTELVLPLTKNESFAHTIVRFHDSLSLVKLTKITSSRYLSFGIPSAILNSKQKSLTKIVLNQSPNLKYIDAHLPWNNALLTKDWSQLHCFSVYFNKNSFNTLELYNSFIIDKLTQFTQRAPQLKTLVVSILGAGNNVVYFTLHIPNFNVETASISTSTNPELCVTYCRRGLKRAHE